MVYTNTQERSSEQGFTLVELAIVMIIIGLLIGGILKGQELIANAQVATTITLAKGLDGATSTFRDKYSAFPGDIANPNNRLANCANYCNAGGNGDGRIGNTPSAAPTAESRGFFAQLATADLITGVLPNANADVLGESFPAVPVGEGGGVFVGFAAAPADLTNAVSNVGASAGHYLTLKANIGAALGGTSAFMTPNDAARMDRKLDDGQPGTGSVRALEAGGSCDNGANPAQYDEDQSSAFCGLFIRIQG